MKKIRRSAKDQIFVAPPANMFDFTFLAPCPSSGLIIHGGADTLVPRESVDDMVDKVQLQKGMEIDYRVVGGANHFFHNSCDDMLMNIHDHLNQAGGGNEIPMEMLGTSFKKEEAA